jgi:prepilin-type processing-associated H-X9-DG protein
MGAHRSRCLRRSGTSLLELLIAISIVGMLIAILLPAVQAARETARKTECGSKLRQMGLAVANYEAVFSYFPPGANSTGYGAHVTLLPYLGDAAYAKMFKEVNQLADPEVGNPVAFFRCPAIYICPSDPITRDARNGTNFGLSFGTGIQVHGYDGAFRHLETSSPQFPEGPTRAADAIDGLTHTAFVSEILAANGSSEFLRVNWYTQDTLDDRSELDDFANQCRTRIYKLDNDGQPRGNLVNRGRPWFYGDAGITFYNHILTPNSPSCVNGTRVQFGAYSTASLHRNGVNVLWGDGHVAFVSATVNQIVWRDFGSFDDKD